MTDETPSFAKLVPGFDFLQNLVQNAGSAMPSMGQWVAPTLNPEELEKRIGELRTVQFWLEQNARVLEATVQALEVQRMTLSTLKTMNVQMGDLKAFMKVPAQEGAKAGAASAASGAGPGPAGAAPASGPGGAVDPMKWWGALTRQFTDLAAAALKEVPKKSASAKTAPASAADAVSIKAASAPRKRAAAKKAAPRRVADKR